MWAGTVVHQCCEIYTWFGSCGEIDLYQAAFVRSAHGCAFFIFVAMRHNVTLHNCVMGVENRSSTCLMTSQCSICSGGHIVSLLRRCTAIHGVVSAIENDLH